MRSSLGALRQGQSCLLRHVAVTTLAVLSIDGAIIPSPDNAAFTAATAQSPWLTESSEDPGNNHTCAVVQSSDPLAALGLETEVRPHRHRLR